MSDDTPLAVAPYPYDDDLIEATRRDGRSRVRVYTLADPIVVLGRGSDPDVELNVDAVRADGVPVYKRRGGGCSVVIDPGNVIVSASEALEGLAGFREAFRRRTEWLIEGLAASGVPGVRWDGISDLVLDDRKISGSCVYRSPGLVFYTATLLVEPNLDLVERYLAHPPREPEYRRGRDHRSFMGRIAIDGLTVEELRRRLVDALTTTEPT